MKLVRTIYLCLVTAVLVGSSAHGQVARRDSATVQRTLRFADEIAAFLKQDSTAPPPSDGILFIGSSTFKLWTRVKEHMAPLPAFNRAFGGSRTHDVLYSMDKIVLPYNPRIIVYYCGSNDIAGGVSPDSVLRNFATFCSKVKTKRPDTKIFYVSIVRAPSRIARWAAMDSANAMISEYCRSTPNLTFIQINHLLVDSNGNPRMELYRDDRLHFKDPAYEELTKVIKPLLETAWKQY